MYKYLNKEWQHKQDFGFENEARIKANPKNKKDADGNWYRVDDDGTLVKYDKQKDGSFKAIGYTAPSGEQATGGATGEGGGGIWGTPSQKINTLNTIVGGFNILGDLYSGLDNADKNYKAKILNSENLLLQADMIQLNAKQQINSMNSELAAGIEDLKYNAVMRGVKYTNGNTQANIEGSLNNMFKDTMAVTRQANLESENMRLQYEVEKNAAKAEKINAQKGAVLGAVNQAVELGVKAAMMMV